jgi:predicted nucleotide-binding protein
MQSQQAGAKMGNGIRWSYRPNIYIHAPFEPAGAQAEVKSAVLDKIKSIGFDPQEFQVSGMPKGSPWSFDLAIEIMRQCDGALILALMRRMESDGTTPAPSEYSHFEGALALSRDLPGLVIAEEGMPRRGILAPFSLVLPVPMQNATKWLADGSLANASAFQTWVESVEARNDVFFGYCSKANNVARNIKSYLTDEVGMRVLDWATDFRPGHTIMEEIARATATCRCGLFLFTTDDPIEGPSTAKAVPRDNVLLEAGYFMSAHTSKRMVVIRENGTRMPADLGGMIYLTLNRRNEWKSVAKDVVTAIRRQLSGNIHARNG